MKPNFIQRILNVLVPPALALGLPGYLKRYLIPKDVKDS